MNPMILNCLSVFAILQPLCAQIPYNGETLCAPAIQDSPDESAKVVRRNAETRLGIESLALKRSRPQEVPASAIFEAVQAGNLRKVVDLIVDDGAGANGYNIYHPTNGEHLLLCAARSKDIRMVTQILNLGADPNCPSRAGDEDSDPVGVAVMETFVDRADMNYYEACLEQMLRYGFDPNVIVYRCKHIEEWRRENCSLLVHVAKRRQLFGCLVTLVAHGAKTTEVEKEEKALLREAVRSPGWNFRAAKYAVDQGLVSVEGLNKIEWWNEALNADNREINMVEQYWKDRLIEAVKCREKQSRAPEKASEGAHEGSTEGGIE